MQARQSYVFFGATQGLKQWVQQQIQQYPLERAVLWVSTETITDMALLHLPHHKVASILGSEFELIIYNAQNGFFPDAFGAVAGTLRAGGYLLLLLPAQEQLTSRSAQRLQQLIHSSAAIKVLHNCQQLPNLPTLSSSAIHQNTADQEQAIQAIYKVVQGHRRRPVVISADRGRGKSAALGIAAQQLLAAGLSCIHITAPSKKTVNTVFKHANSHPNLHFIAPDELLQQRPKTALLLVDEAAAIPTPILKQLLNHYSRIVFSTTLHGYEGTGRGFEIRFQKILNQHTPNWCAVHLKTPIRWQENDPLECFVYRSLLLNAQQEACPKSSTQAFKISQIQRDQLLNNETQLQHIFGLLVSAHYQTKPSNLYYLLDHPDISLFVIQHQHCIVATALTICEGNIDQPLHANITAGKRRLRGHLIPQSLAFHAGLPQALALQGERIIRIAVHSEYQRQGLATQLMAYIKQKKGHCDYLGVSFSATIEMAQFWQKQGFQTVRIGLQRDASSGTHSLIQLLALSNQGNKLVQQTTEQFQYSLPHLLSEPLTQLAAEFIIPLLQCHTTKNIQLSTWQWQELHAFSYTHRGYEVCIASLWTWLIQFMHTQPFKYLDNQQQAVLISKILQKHSWQQLVKHYHFTGKKAALAYLKAIIATCLPHKIKQTPPH